ncbi:CgeB family protein [Micrococcus luteus]|uniref:glycosyltransferase family 1 protein n=1 Tax=Micrococcus luteus TaxID=1270 RepID=UPI001303541C|nr:glycosyltransferase family 1 protein [Micrococcus luteus]
MSVDVVYIRPGGTGWGPVAELAHLTARLLGATLTEIDDRGRASAVQRGAVLLPRGRRAGGRRLLVIAGNPAALAFAARRHLWFPGYASTAAWVIDSFWTDRIAGIAKHRPHFDHLFITDPDLVDEWADRTGRPVDVLPWGSDTLAFEPVAGEKSIDLLRLGRQPSAWDDDAVTAKDAERHGLSFRGRPPAAADPLTNQENVRTALLESKIVLAFSNRVSPAAYTHPTREYLTGRWMDALAAGCLVAGVAPRSAAQLLWDGATMDISPHSRADAWPVLGEAAAGWSIEAATRQQELARRTVDWRHRLRRLVDIMGWPHTEQLTTESHRLT